jgi:methionyl-tRNA formyltransferase
LSNEQQSAIVQSPCVIFFGMRGTFSLLPLVALLEAGIDVRAVVVPADASTPAERLPAVRQGPGIQARMRLPVVRPYLERTIASIAWEHGIPVVEVGRLSDTRTIATLAAYRPDVIAVACFNQKLPPAILALPPLGCLNVHPSLLPANRGPEPLFWTFRRGEAMTGVTVHLMDEELDAGDIIFQESLAVPDGITGDELERRAAALGGELLVRAIRALADGTATRTPQQAERASMYPYPAPEDFVVTPDRSARWAFNFLRGAAHWRGPLAIQVGEQRFPVAAALDYAPDATLPAPFIQSGDELWVQCTPGVVHVRVAGPAVFR